VTYRPSGQLLHPVAWTRIDRGPALGRAGYRPTRAWHRKRRGRVSSPHRIGARTGVRGADTIMSS